MPQTTQSASGRFDALDTLRCLAVLVMVQGHSFYVTLTHSEHGSDWYRWHNYLHGYTAPAFLFGAGLAFGYTTLSNRVAEHGTWGPVLSKRLYRYLSLFVIGYAIQLPPLGMATLDWSLQSVRVFLRAEALQHIAAALLFAQLLVVAVRRALPVVLLCAGLGVSIVLSGPVLSRVPLAEWGSPAIAAYMTGASGSTFPLIPWAGFVMAGIVVGAVVRQARQATTDAWVAVGFVTLGAAAVTTSLWLDTAWPDVFGEHAYWKVSPYFFVRRLGWVLAMLGVFAGVDCVIRRWSAETKVGSVRTWIRLISQQSLVAYVAHLVILYGSPFSPGLRTILSKNLGPLGSSVVVLGLFVALGGLLLFWTRLERNYEPRFYRFRRTGVAVMAATTLVAAVRTAGYPMGGTPVIATSHAATMKLTPVAGVSGETSEFETGERITASAAGMAPSASDGESISRR